MLIIPANSASAAGGFDVANSVRYNNGSEDYLSRTQSASPTSATKGTFSVWLKRSLLGVDQYIYTVFQDGNNRMQMNIKSDDVLKIIQKVSSSTTISLITNRVLRDVSAFYHICIAIDTTQGTASNRIKMYINGVQETSFSTETYPNQNQDAFFTKGTAVSFGAYNSSGNWTSGYFSEAVMIDGQQLDPTSFGEFDDSGIWKPKDVSGLTFGTNGYYLEFKQSGTGTNASGIGADTSGNTNHFAVNNLTAVDQSTDTCTNNFCTFMSHTSGSYATLSEGGLVSTGNSSSDSGSSLGSFGMTNGKWYWEFEFDTQNSGYGLSGAIDTTAAKFGIQGGVVGYPVPQVYMISVGGNMSNGSSEQSGWTSDYSNGDVLGMAFDMDNGAWYMHLNGTYYDSGNPASGGSKTGAVVGWTPNGKTLVPIVTSYNGSIEKFNFGSPPYAISSGNQDGNGFGNFEYAVPSGYFALCTKNLAEFG